MSNKTTYTTTLETPRTTAPAVDQAADDQQSRHTAQAAAMIDEDAESWITLMMGLDAAKEKPELRTEFEEKLAPAVLRAANECSSYEDFKQRLAQYQAEGSPNA